MPTWARSSRASAAETIRKSSAWSWVRTITALPEPGTVLERGDVAFEVDGRPVGVMFGRRPAWRPMSAGTGDGHDIMQLEANLLLLGYTADDFEVDREFTELTADLVSEWQADLEIEETGSVDLGRVLFLPRSVRIADIAVDLGMAIAPGTPLLTTTSTRQEVQLWLDADRQDLLDLDDIVGIELPDETVTTGTVANISDVVTTIGSGPDARRVFEVTIRLNDSTAAAGLDEAPVDVDVVSEEASDVLAVPVDALLALAEGGYAVQRLQSDGASEFVAVDIGKFADGLVAVTGDLREGDFVLVPR